MTSPQKLLHSIVIAVAVAVLIGIGAAPVGAQDGSEGGDTSEEQQSPPKPPDPPDPDDVVRRQLLIVDPSGTALDGGGSATPFTVELEGEDECPGDSAHDQYRVDSYLVPVDEDPTQQLFTGFGPTPIEFRSYEDFQSPLFDTQGDPFAAALTAQQLEPGGPGPIRELPYFDLLVYVPTPGVEDYDGGLPAGEYRLGIACTYAARITNLWETSIEIVEDPADEPVGVTWTTTGPRPLDLESAVSESRLPAIGLIALAVVLAAVSLLLFRTSRRSEHGTDRAVHEEPVVG